MAGAYAIISGGGNNRVPQHIIGHVATLAALAAWRVTQGIYKFDPDLMVPLLDTPMAGDLPCEVLRRMPEWCVYIETPGRIWSGQSMHGFFAHIESDANTGREELRLLIDTEDDLVPIPIHLGPWPLQEAVARAIDVSRVHASAIGETIPASIHKDIIGTAEPLISLLLYLCADDADISDGSRSPGRPAPTMTKTGARLFPPDKPKKWNVGVRIGAALRKAKEQPPGSSAGDEAGPHASPRAHIRRAHWHTYLIGAGRADRRLKWLPPIAVNVQGHGDLPAVIHHVKK